MREKHFRDFLLSKGFPVEKVDQHLNVMNELETDLKRVMPFWTFEDLNHASVQSFVNVLIDTGKNSPENLLVLLRYAKAINNIEMYNSLFEMLDGCEAIENLFNRLGEYVGEDLRDSVFEHLPLPPVGLSKKEKALFTYQIMHRIEEVFGESFSRELLSESLRNLPETYFSKEQEDFFNKCDGNIDMFLVHRGKQFIETLQEHFQTGELFFGQKITSEVIEYVRKNPEIGAGTRVGNKIYETKIPFNTVAYLAEPDQRLKRYHYCHCPWIKESIRNNRQPVSATFCQCSAGFHKKPFEVVYQQKLKAEVIQSVLNGDLVCRFIIYLPEN